MKTGGWISVLLVVMSGAFGSAWAEEGFTQKDRELLIALKVKVEEIDKRFEQVDKRFEQVDKRFEQVDKRFEQVDKRFEQMFTFLWILAGIFTTLTGATIGFAVWDRRTMVRPFELRMRALEEGKVDRVIHSLRDLAQVDKNLADALRRHNLL